MATKKPAAKSKTGKVPSEPKRASRSAAGAPSDELVARFGDEYLGYEELKKRKLSLAVFLDAKNLKPVDWEVLEAFLLKLEVGPVVIAESCSVPPPVTRPGGRPKPKK